MPTYEKYTSLSDNEFIRATYEDGVQRIFPLDPANSDYQAYLASLNADKL